jgi:hypothetical protein
MATTLLLRRVPVLAHAVAAILSSSPNPPIALPHSVAHRHILQVTRRPTLSSSLWIRGEGRGSARSRWMPCDARRGLRSTPRLQDASPSAAGFTAGSQIANDHHHATANDFNDVTVHQYNAMVALVPCVLRRRMYKEQASKQGVPKRQKPHLPKQGQSPKAGAVVQKEVTPGEP